MFKKIGNYYYKHIVLSKDITILKVLKKYNINIMDLLEANKGTNMVAGAIIKLPINYRIVLIDKDIKQVVKQYNTTIKQVLIDNDKTRDQLVLNTYIYVRTKDQS